VPSSQPDAVLVPPSSVGTSRRQLLVAAVTLAGVYICVFGPGVLNSIREIVGGVAPGASSSWTDRVAALEWDVFVTAVVVVVVVRWLPKHAPLVTARMRLGSRPTRWVPAGVLGASAAYVAIASASTWAADHVVADWHLAHGTYSQLGAGTGGFVVTSFAAAAAGFTEETVLVALVAAVVEHYFDARGGRSRWALPTMIAVLVSLRWLVHLYYLWGGVFVLLWAPAVYLLYRWVGSVWPLVLGHCFYDWFAIAGQSYPGLSHALGVALWIIAATGALAIGVSVARGGRSSAVSSAENHAMPRRGEPRPITLRRHAQRLPHEQIGLGMGQHAGGVRQPVDVASGRE
jgi:hypothetical protein